MQSVGPTYNVISEKKVTFLGLPIPFVCKISQKAYLSAINYSKMFGKVEKKEINFGSNSNFCSITNHPKNFYH